MHIKTVPGVLLIVSCALLFFRCTPEADFRAAAPAPALTVAPRAPFAVLSWVQRTLRYLPGRRGEAAACFGARSTEDQDWEIEHPTQGWLQFAASETPAAAMVAQVQDEGDVFVADSATCGLQMGTAMNGGCFPNATGGSSSYVMYGWEICFFDASAGYCANVWQVVGMSHSFDDTLCTGGVISTPTYNPACSVTRP